MVQLLKNFNSINVNDKSHQVSSVAFNAALSFLLMEANSGRKGERELM